MIFPMPAIYCVEGACDPGISFHVDSINCHSGPSVTCNLIYPDLGQASPHLSVGLMRDGEACYVSLTQCSSYGCSELEIDIMGESLNATFIEFSGKDGVVEVSLVGPEYGPINDECDITVLVEGQRT